VVIYTDDPSSVSCGPLLIPSLVNLIRHTLVGVRNYPSIGPWFGDYPSDLRILNNCHQNLLSRSELGGSYGRGPGVNPYGQERFRVVDYEVFKIVIE
jgi:hypothetical protein